MKTKEITIGITGHRDIRQADVPLIESKLREKLEEISEKHKQKNLLILSGKAEGADQIVLKLIEELREGSAYKERWIWVDLNLAVDPSKTNGDQKLDFYHSQAEHLAKACDIIIALWDGVYTYKEGGTSEVVRMALASGRSCEIHQLVCPRASNTCPVNSLEGLAIDYQARKFVRIPFSQPFAWAGYKNKGEKHLLKKVKGRVGDIRGFIWKTIRRQLFWAFATPILLSLCTVVLGTYGFSQLPDADRSINHFFRAVNLINLNESVAAFKGSQNINIWLEIARITGLLTLVFTFAYALLLALKDFREGLIRLIWRYTGFILVVGYSDKSIALLRNLAREQRKIVLLVEPGDAVEDEELKQNASLIIVRGSLSSVTMLRTVYATKAKMIFVMSASDTMNVRGAQELVALANSRKRKYPPVYVHIQDEEYAKFLRNNLHKHALQPVVVFNVYENTVRRLFLHHPPDRFYQSKTADTIHTVIIGFDEMGKQILLTLLKQGHYNIEKKVRIYVYCQHAEKQKASFRSQYPHAFKDDDADEGACNEKGANRKPTALANILHYVWNPVELEFVEMPSSDVEWLSDHQPMYQAVNKRTIVNLYTGLKDGITSAAYLHTILPKYENLHRNTGCNVQAFCYYNIPDKKEERRIEAYLNEVAPELYVKFFGNDIDECSIPAIQSMSLDEVGKLINAFYVEMTDAVEEAIKKNEPIERWPILSQDHVQKCWDEARVKDKLSSQQAGDHMWVKLRNKSRPEELKTADADLSILAETEHRRWAAEMLLQGFIPLDLKPRSPEYEEKITYWNYKPTGTNEEKSPGECKLEEDKIHYKKRQLEIKRHINLVPFDQLADSESNKDYRQIRAIPYFLKQALQHPTNTLNKKI